MYEYPRAAARFPRNLRASANNFPLSSIFAVRKKVEKLLFRSRKGSEQDAVDSLSLFSLKLIFAV